MSSAGRGVGERAHRDEIHAGFGDAAHGFQSDAAAGFKHRADMFAARGDGFPQFREGHVVEQDVIDSVQCEKLADLVEIVGLEFHFDAGFLGLEAEDRGLECQRFRLR